MRPVFFSLLSLAPLACADEILLRSGGRISGVVAERSASSVTVDVGPGRITLPLSRVDRIVPGSSDLAVYRQRAGTLAPENAQGWLELGRWARERGLLTQAGEAFERALAADPQNAAAHQAAGHVLMSGRWLSSDDAYRAQGYVPFEGRWVTPQEHEALVRGRAERAATEHARIESEARAREADARARAAEAEARRAEADRGITAGAGAYGVPLWLAGPATWRFPRACASPMTPATPPVAPPVTVVVPAPHTSGWTHSPHTHAAPIAPVHRP